jgi:acetolactate synthase-1/2/3 large subunit
MAKNIQVDTMEWEYDPAPVHLPGYRQNLRPGEPALEQAVEMIRAAKRPLILAGHGALISGAMEELRYLAKTTHTPVAMTLLDRLPGQPVIHSTWARWACMAQPG